MRKKIFQLGILCAVGISGCIKLMDIIGIDVDVPYAQTIAVPQDTSLTNHFPPAGIYYYSSALPVATNQQNLVSSNNTTLGMVTAFSLKKLTLLDSPSTATFNFLDSVEVYISKNAGDSTLIAYKYNVPQNSDSLVLDIVPDIDLKPYLLLDTFYFKFDCHYNSLPPTNVQTITINSVMNLKANPLK
jgi:hypothetical protein